LNDNGYRARAERGEVQIGTWGSTLTIGPTDLAQDLGVLGTAEQRDVLNEYRRRLVDACRKHGKAVSMAVDSVETVREMITMGATIVNFSSETAVLRAGYATAVAAIRAPARS
jgi:2-keto-3-deoxy-L-rhamnonate aldolase RhmA